MDPITPPPTPPKPPRAKPKPRRRDQHNNALGKAVEVLGSVRALARTCNRQPSACWRWVERGSLPRTEWTGETHYAELIEAACQGAVTREQLLATKPIRRPPRPKPQPDTDPTSAT